MALDVAGIVAALESVARKIGGIEDVITAEPKSAPGEGVYCAIWLQDFTPIPGDSGLQSVSMNLIFQARLMKRMLSLPYGGIDPDLLTATSSLMSAYAAGFTLGAEVQSIDLLGRYGTKMAGKAGYITLDKAMFRVVDISLPLVINDVFVQVP